MSTNKFTSNLPAINMSTKPVFLSHASSDKLIASELKAALKQEVGITCFMLHDEVSIGYSWINEIQTGLDKCQMLFSLVTPRSIGRPWLAAEWACFALQKEPRPWALLRMNVRQSEIWTPMLSNQDADLSSADDVEKLLKQLAQQTGQTPKSGFRAAAMKLSANITDAYTRIQQDQIEDAITSLLKNSQTGTDNLRPDDIRTVIQGGRLPDALAIFLHTDASDVKRRQFAVELVKCDRFADALKICHKIGNKNEIKNVAVQVVDRTPVKSPADSEEWTFLCAIYHLLKEPQRRVVWERMNERQLLLRCDWETYRPKGSPVEPSDKTPE